MDFGNIASSGIKTTGQWIYEGLEEVVYSTITLNSSLSFDFNGTDLYFLMARGTNAGQGVFVLDGKSFEFDGFAPSTQTAVCGLCITNLPSQQHNVNLTYTSLGRADVDVAFLFISALIYNNDLTVQPNETTPVGAPTQPPPATPGVSISVILGATLGIVGVLLASAIVFYFYRRSRRRSNWKDDYHNVQSSSSLARKPSATVPGQTDHSMRVRTEAPQAAVALNVDQLTVQVERLANMLEVPGPPPAYDGEDVN